MTNELIRIEESFRPLAGMKDLTPEVAKHYGIDAWTKFPSPRGDEGLNTSWSGTATPYIAEGRFRPLAGMKDLTRDRRLRALDAARLSFRPLAGMKDLTQRV